ncbi:MAG: sulfatase [Planctomycetaceae bacterium]|nr:sulfatase [Planctomycetaceae bacterium]
MHTELFALYFTWLRGMICICLACSPNALLMANTSQPNVLLILSDDHSVPHISCYGDINTTRFHITPNLQKFAEQGMRFDRAYTTAPQCAPSRISIFACRSPVGLGVTRFAQPAQADAPFFTDVLRAGGYWVGLDGRHHHLDGRIRDAEHIDTALRNAGMQNLKKRFDHIVRSAKTKGNQLDQVSSRVSAALDTVPDNKPFFLYFGFNQPHRKFSVDYDGIDPNELRLPPDWPDLPEVRVDYARYLASVRELDRGFGQIMQLLADRGIEENTLVIFMGDNGEALLRGKGTLYARGTHVPLLIRWPGHVAAHSHSSALVCGTDLGPTILEVCGMKALKGMTGQSFADDLFGKKSDGRRYVFAERGWHFGPITRTDGLDFSRSITSDRFHYIYNALPDRSYTPVDMAHKDAWKAIQQAHTTDQLSPLHQRLYFKNPRPIVELYDLEHDPLELDNLAGNPSTNDTEKKLRETLEAWMIRESDFLPLPTHAIETTTNLK